MTIIKKTKVKTLELTEEVMKQLNDYIQKEITYFTNDKDYYFNGKKGMIAPTKDLILNEYDVFDFFNNKKNDKLDTYFAYDVVCDRPGNLYECNRVWEHVLLFFDDRAKWTEQYSQNDYCITADLLKY